MSVCQIIRESRKARVSSDDTRDYVKIVIHHGNGVIGRRFKVGLEADVNSSDFVPFLTA